MKYEPRFYHSWTKDESLVSFEVIVYETHLWVRAKSNLKNQTEQLVKKYRTEIEEYSKNYPEFKYSLKPVKPRTNLTAIVTEMIKYTAVVNVGPMAAVAGAIAEYVGNELLSLSSELIIENGGDIYIHSAQPRVVGIYAGKSKFSGKLGIELPGYNKQVGVCTSSGTVGHSLSFGKADAVVIVSHSTTFADALATAAANIVQTKNDIEKTIKFAQKFGELLGIVVIKDDKLGVAGEIKLVQIKK